MWIKRLSQRWPNKGRRLFQFAFAILLLKIAATLSACHTLPHSYDCQFDTVSFTANFPGGRLNGCEQLSSSAFELTITPEGLPINDSPWYAFRINSKGSQTINIVLQFVDGSARYQPKISRDGKHWTSVPHQHQEQSTTFSLDLQKESLLVAGQELLLAPDYDLWLQQKAEKESVHLITVGESVKGQPIKALDIHSNNQDTIVILGRQHPPEVTGALALFPFVDRILADTDLAVNFRERFRVIVIPLVNPDGVVAGTWRHNSNNIDTNRDWGVFSQPETKVIAEFIATLANQGQQFYLGLDFHSTEKNYFYTQQDGDPLCPQSFTAKWIEGIKKAQPDFSFRRSSRSSDGNPTFKQWFNETYGVPSISYEMGDNIDRGLLVEVATTAADSMMKELLSTHCP